MKVGDGTVGVAFFVLLSILVFLLHRAGTGMRVLIKVSWFYRCFVASIYLEEDRCSANVQDTIRGRDVPFLVNGVLRYVMSFVLGEHRRTLAFFRRFSFQSRVLLLRFDHLFLLNCSFFFLLNFLFHARSRNFALVILVRYLYLFYRDVCLYLPFFKGLVRLLINAFVDEGVLRCMFRVCRHGLLHRKLYAHRSRRTRRYGWLLRLVPCCVCG